MKSSTVNRNLLAKKRTGWYQSLNITEIILILTDINKFIRNHVLSHHKDIGEQNVAVLLDKIRNMQLPEPEFISETSNNVDQ